MFALLVPVHQPLAKVILVNKICWEGKPGKSWCGCINTIFPPLGAWGGISVFIQQIFNRIFICCKDTLNSGLVWLPWTSIFNPLRCSRMREQISQQSSSGNWFQCLLGNSRLVSFSWICHCQLCINISSSTSRIYNKILLGITYNS